MIVTNYIDFIQYLPRFFYGDTDKLSPKLLVTTYPLLFIDRINRSDIITLDLLLVLIESLIIAGPIFLESLAERFLIQINEELFRQRFKGPGSSRHS